MNRQELLTLAAQAKGVPIQMRAMVQIAINSATKEQIEQVSAIFDEAKAIILKDGEGGGIDGLAKFLADKGVPASGVTLIRSLMPSNVEALKDAISQNKI